MKKLVSLILALSLVFSMMAPSFAVNDNNSTTDDLPYWVEEGETWHPASEIATCEDDGCPQSHFAPKGYTYQGYTEGNSIFDSFVQGGLVKLVGNLPGIGLIVKIIDAATTLEWLIPLAETGYLPTTYHKYVYTNGSLYWHHYNWYYRSPSDKLFRHLTCDVKTNA